MLNVKYKMGIIFILCLILLTLASCKQVEKGGNQLSENEQITVAKENLFSFEHPKTEQKYKIVHVNQLFHQYIEKVKENKSHSNLQLYKEEIIQPIYKDCFANGEYLYLADTLLNTPPEKLGELQMISNIIEKRKEEINQLIQESILKSADLLPSQSDVAVCVFPSTYVDMSMFAVGAGKIIFPYNLNYTDDIIKAGIAHEYHHSVWTEKHLKNNTLNSVLDNIVFEGKAVMFQRTVYPDIDFPSVDLNYNKELWSKIEPDLNTYNLSRSLEIIQGGKELPRNYGYSEGYKMINSYLEYNPDKTPVDWTAVSTQDIIEKGKYFENYK
ncbi:uncharacterized protein YjaZ [Cytobacillus eiseniae]|uniref:Uncharacterized protein YjaZ n=1 Tax=Cytobacillus eiseniae TaxID=762947 RepID=A0ABS4RJ94_9BACI|nr:DUF2268 domain-containing putative Zn-dependent protease [Cytobacillus eiseniae]MBP2242979.1 uncharacterized protein YjaZ [Cytobacillus eiseniae]